MPQLEPKHLAPYLPYGTLVVVIRKIHTMYEHSRAEYTMLMDAGVFGYMRSPDTFQVLPKVIPLTDETHYISLANWIQRAEGENFDNFDSALSYIRLCAYDIQNAPFKLVNEFCRYHYDIWDLLGKGLAYQKV